MRITRYQTPSGEPWRVSRFYLLVEDCGFADKEGFLPAWHSAVSENAAAWRVARALYGIHPVVTTPGLDTTVRSRSDLAEEMGITVPKVGDWVAALRGAMEAEVRRSMRPEVRGQKSENRDQTSDLRPLASDLRSLSSDPLPPKGELALTPARPAVDPLVEFGFPESMFDVDKRSLEAREEERTWFRKEVAAWKDLLANAKAQTLCRDALVTSLMLRRIETEILKHVPGTEKFNVLRINKVSLQGQYMELMDKLDQIAPWMGVIGDGVSLGKVASEFIRAAQEFHAREDRRLVDGIFTAAEVEVQLRRSQQFPEPAYRAGLVRYLTTAKQGLFDPNWQPGKNEAPASCRVLDVAMRRLIGEILDANGVGVVDLLDDTDSGEFPELRVASDEGRRGKDVK